MSMDAYLQSRLGWNLALPQTDFARSSAMPVWHVQKLCDGRGIGALFQLQTTPFAEPHGVPHSKPPLVDRHANAIKARRGSRRAAHVDGRIFSIAARVEPRPPEASPVPAEFTSGTRAYALRSAQIVHGSCMVRAWFGGGSGVDRGWFLHIWGTVSRISPTADGPTAPGWKTALRIFCTFLRQMCR